ncbi:MAG: tRNA (adenosine(37)-N6)-threonylcarbamoyltransferase complex transferase subunit TsaD [Desulfobacteraceae bacterium]|jgi:N6-L-threonylcarbamoyladenine synthase
MIILGIESSCDETAAAVVKDGFNVLSSVVASQIEVHHIYGGVVPELASRKHMEAIVPVVKQALYDADLSADALNGIAVTQGPGLIGSLLVGFSFAKAFAFGNDLPFVGVNHLEGHLQSIFLEPDPPAFPYVALLVSGGHTSIYHVLSHTQYHLLGQTRDDAAGEAYDKVAKMLGLGYPGGRVIDELAAKGDPEKIKFPRAFLDKNSCDFSFSGIKSAVGRYLKENGPVDEEHMTHIAAGFQAAVTEVLSYKIIQAAITKKTEHLTIVGGVAANSGLRKAVRQLAASKGLNVYLPQIKWCGDNAAMIASAGFHHLIAGKRGDLDDDVYSRVLLRKQS